MPLARFPHGFEYPDNHGIPLSDIAATLIAHERMLPLVGELLEQLIPGVTVESVAIELDKVEQGSLSEAFFVAILVVFQKDLEREVPGLIESLTHTTIPDAYDTIVTVLFVALLYTGAKVLIERAKRSGEASRIQAELDAHIDEAAKTLNVTPDRMRSALDKVVTGKRRPGLVRATIDLFRPAKRGGDGKIVPRRLRAIEKETVAEFPTDVVMAELDKDTVPIPIPRAHLRIRATDRDKADKGWAGKIENDDLQTKRLPLVLAPTVDPDQVASLEHAEVEAVLESKMTDDGRTKPYRIHVMRVLS